MRSSSALSFIDAPVASRSIHGDSGTAAAGSGIPSSRSLSSVAIVSPPPAESPEMATCCGANPVSSSHR